QVSASIAHDLRNPLGAMRNATFYLKRHAPAERPEIAEFCGIIEDEITTADGIIGGLLQLTRSSPVNKRRVCLRELVEHALARISNAGAVRCHVSTDPDAMFVEADPAQLQQVFFNLMKNATEAMKGNGEFVVEGRVGSECDVIIVRDNGPGIREKLPGGIFEPLVTSKTKGTGLGLTICRQIVTRHEGTIELIKEHRRGAAFRITLPRGDGTVHARRKDL
ncbi:MAG: sensor histidine kinase, partial [bacterium]